MPHNRIRSRHQPFEIAIMATAPVCGALLIVLDVRPQSVAMAMPGPIQAGWESGLIVVGVAGLLGVLWPGRLSTGLGIELASLLMLGTVTGMYAVALTVVTGRQGVAATSFIVAVAVGSGWRAVQIVLDLRRLTRAGQTTGLAGLAGSGAVSAGGGT
ncbi:hypothetical protein OG777_22780 [Micromonospora peucetia]|uniref:Uncharacterized protein n=1 Tax=Micromonospora peucetia TaxID=47871 RepID=A0A1C6VFF4_9ACTN|nr:hypothetical protein [Micromonospora peucetia]MCX4389736.1 hypothetical protein [Micromonospora peucetia]WSA30205.1 hypothetical protein OIE14_18535 [Micromonospora peucetia]SCL64897.1 hypothetical protein GA0070608_3030 [Micromonospora peucetia]